MALAQVKKWVEAQRWLAPVLPLLRLAWAMLKPVRAMVSALRHPRTFVRRQPLLRALIPVCRLLETLLVSWLLPIRVLSFLYHRLWFHAVGRHRIRVPAPATGPRRIVMMVCSNLAVDPRVRQEAQALARGGFLVTVICPAWSPNVQDCARISWGNNIAFRILPMRSARFVCRYPYLFGRTILLAALAEDAWAYHAHDLDMSFIALLAAARKGVACVCDFHEWYSENVTYDPWTEQYRPHHFLKRRLYQSMERLVIHHASRVITVCRSIADFMEQVYQSPQSIALIRNIPALSLSEQPGENLRAKLAIPTDKKIVLYQGGMGPSRNLEPVIQAMRYTPGAVLVIRGPGFEAHGRDYRKLAATIGCADRVFCLPPVPAPQVVAEARAADAGLWTLLSNVGLNFKLALPNKVFEYLAAGIPILAADLPEVRAIVNGYGVGLCFDPDDPASIAACINRLVADPAFGLTCRANIKTALAELRADQEWNKLVDLYRQLAENTEDVARVARAG
jgi:glycosyltransferase involved in cell wall biosynthesis